MDDDLLEEIVEVEMVESMMGTPVGYQRGYGRPGFRSGYAPYADPMTLLLEEEIIEEVFDDNDDRGGFGDGDFF